MRHNDVHEDGMGFSGLAPTATERAHDAYEDTRRKVAAAREKRLAELAAENACLLAALDGLLGLCTRASGISEDNFAKAYGAAEDALAKARVR